MIGNPRRADLVRQRLEELEMLKLILDKLKWMKPGPQRDEFIGFAKQWGQFAKETKELIEKEDREGTPEKWVRYYELMEKLDQMYARDKQPHPKVDR